MAISEEEYFALTNGNENKQKPIYEYSRNEQGKIEINNKSKTNPQTIEEINNDIINKSIDNKKNIIEEMITDSYNELTKIQIEMEVLQKMYELYNKNIYLKQIESYKNRRIELINKIRILKELKEKN